MQLEQFNARYKIYPELNFGVFRLNAGVKTFKEVYNLAEFIRHDKDFHSILYQLVDLRGSSFDFEVKRIPEFIEMQNSYQDINNQLRRVYLVDTPKETAYIQLFFKSLENLREICLTLPAAYDLLGIYVSYEEFQSLVELA